MSAEFDDPGMKPGPKIPGLEDAEAVTEAVRRGVNALRRATNTPDTYGSRGVLRCQECADPKLLEASITSSARGAAVLICCMEHGPQFIFEFPEPPPKDVH